MTAFYLEREKEGQAGNMSLPTEAQINGTFTKQVTYERVKPASTGSRNIFISTFQLKLKAHPGGQQAIKIKIFWCKRYLVNFRSILSTYNFFAVNENN